MRKSEIRISSSSFESCGRNVHRLNKSIIACDEGKEGDLLFMLLFLISRIKDILREEISPEMMLNLIEKVINNNIIFFETENPIEYLEKCLERSNDDDRPE